MVDLYLHEHVVQVWETSMRPERSVSAALVDIASGSGYSRCSAALGSRRYRVKRICSQLVGSLSIRARVTPERAKGVEAALIAP